MDELKNLRYKLEQKKGQLSQLKTQKESTERQIIDLQKEIRASEQAQVIIQKVAKETQETLQYHISELCSLALSAVFDDPYSLELEFVIKRGKTEADIYLTKNGERYDPLTATGGGVVDVAAFALRVALWSLAPTRSRSTIILDEPFRYLSRDLQPKAAEMLSELSEKIGIQFIMVSHSNDLIGEADKVFPIKLKKRVSHIGN